MSTKPEIITSEEIIKAKTNIAFIGFMGSGKSTISKVLAKKTDLKSVDIDRLISEKVGMDIPSIFSQYGEEYFRDLEEEILKQVLRVDGQIISCGGGIILRESNRNLLKQRAINCWLDSSAETSISRIKHSGRPLLSTENPLETAKKLISERTALYQEVADIKLNTDHLSIDEIAAIFYEITHKVFFC